MQKRKVMSMLAVLLVSAMMGSTVSAAPSVDEIKEQKEEASAEVSSLQEELKKVISEINELEEQLISKGEEIVEATDDLEAAKIKEQEQYEAMKLRIKYMYEEGGTAAVEKIAESGSIAELLTQAEYIQSVHTYDREQLTAYVETKNEIKELKSTLETEQKELEKTQVSFTEKKEELDTTIEEKREEVADLDEQLEAAIEAAAKEAAEKAAREAAAKEEAEKNSSNSGNSNNSGTNNNNSNNNNSSDNDSNKTDSNKNDSDSSSDNSSSSTSSSSKAQAIVDAAYSQLGTPYVWGGTTPYKGLDCSGLTQYCHRMAGISIARTSGAQGASGTRVTNPKPGDIVCYSGHVGIYIGNNKMIHAPQPGDVVKIQTVYGSPWYRRYW